MAAQVPTQGGGGYLSWLGEQFDAGVNDLSGSMDVALTNLQKNPSQPDYLAAYQRVLSDYNIYRNAQSSSVKAMKDTDSAIVANFR